jgi:hypothetical protein
MGMTMSYETNRPSMRRPDDEPWTKKLWDWIQSTFWLLFLLCLLGGLIYLAYQAVMTEMDAAKPGSKVGVPK